MKLKIIGVLSLVFLSYISFAQDEVPEASDNSSDKPLLSNTKIGLSGRVTNFYLVDQIQSTISIPILVRNKFKIEPEIGYFSEKVENPISSSFNDEAFLHIGVCLAMLKSYNSGLLNIGIRGGIVKSWVDGESNSGTNYFAGPVVGYDHFLSDNFSIGLDINPSFMKVVNNTVFKTNTSVRLSFFF